MKVDKIKAVHSDDLEQYLESLGLLSSIKEGRFLCSICGKIITLENILCIYPENQEVKFCCDSSECYEVILKKRDTNE